MEYSARVGDHLGIGLYAVAESGSVEYFSAVQAVLAWPPDTLRLLGVDQTGAVGLYASGFPLHDAYNLNEASPPADGDGLWVGLAFPAPLPATPEGVLLTTMLYEALTPGVGEVAVLPSGGNPVGYTKVIGTVPNLNILGQIGEPAVVTVVPEPSTAWWAALVGVATVRRLRGPRVQAERTAAERAV